MNARKKITKLFSIQNIVDVYDKAPVIQKDSKLSVDMQPTECDAGKSLMLRFETGECK